MSDRPSAEAHPAELNAKVLSSLALWIRAKHGVAKLAEIADAADFDHTNIDGSTKWLSVEQCERFFAEARKLVPDDDAFLRACGEHFFESVGAVRHMVWAISERQFFEAAAKMSKLMLRIGRFEVIDSARDSFRVRYLSEKPESRLMCLSRQASWIYGPTMWGMPLAQLTEKSCIANGDASCEYHLRWYERGRIFPLAIGFAAGVAAALLVAWGNVPLLASASLPLLGAAVGRLIEVRRISASNLRFAGELNEVLRNLGQDEVEARSEIVLLHQRQREWIRLMEQQVTERTTTLERIVEGLDGLQQSRVTTIRGFSHDLRNPLFVLRGNTQFLREKLSEEGDEGEALRDMETAAIQIETMLSQLMEVAAAETGFVKLQPRPVSIAPLAETFRRRLKALVHGRDIKVSVFCTREAPSEITIDPLVFDRVVDNLLTNAAKYTERGSILLEISGTPALVKPGVAVEPSGSESGYLTLKLSDTGLGIATSGVDRIFRPRPAHEPTTPNSYGIGLSSVVRLMAQIGGRLDVMSKVDVGTTFWAHFPVVAPEQKKMTTVEDNIENMITRVVTIRKAEAT